MELESDEGYIRNSVNECPYQLTFMLRILQSKRTFLAAECNLIGIHLEVEKERQASQIYELFVGFDDLRFC